MGMLTEDMTRLRNEILALRSSRQGLIHDLERETEDRQADVSRRLAHFSKGFSAVARRTKADRLGSISDLKRTVSDVLTGVRTDLSGIRQAWLVLGTDSRGAADTEGRRSQTGGKGRLGHLAGEKPARRKPKR
jgi:hypothetical protein